MEVARSAGEPSAWAAMYALYLIAINGKVCTPPDTWSDPWLGGDGSGKLFDVDALKCDECRRAWKLVEAVVKNAREELRFLSPVPPAVASPERDTEGEKSERGAG